MKRRDKLQASPIGRDSSLPKVRRFARVGVGTHLLQVHPIPRTRYEILAIAMHFVRCFAAAAGKAAPDLSEDAAAFLASRAWAVTDLAMRVSRAVASNCGNLITAADLSES